MSVLPVRKLASWWRWGVAISVVLLLGVSIFSAQHWMRTSDRFLIKVVQVEGDLSHTGREALVATIENTVSGNFFDIDVDAVRVAAESLPWVAQAQIRMLWPATVNVRVEEHHPIARWGSDALLSDDAIIFKVRDRDNQLPLFEAGNGRAQVLLKQYLSWSEMLSKEGFEITQLQLDSRGAWSFELNHTAWVQAGQELPGQRLQRFVSALNKFTPPQRQSMKRIDLRYANGFAIAWQPSEFQQEGGGDAITG